MYDCSVPETITCPDGARVTCAIAEIADIMNHPSLFLWVSSIWLPLLAAVASTAVAIVSVVIARKARNMAEKSEKARIDAEAIRVKIEQQRRLDSAIRDLFVGIAALMDEITSVEEANNEAFREWSRAGHDGKWPRLKRVPLPTSSGVRALIAAAELEAHEVSDREMLAQVERRVKDSDKLSPEARATALTAVWEFVVSWRRTSDTVGGAAVDEGEREPNSTAAVP